MTILKLVRRTRLVKVSLLAVFLCAATYLVTTRSYDQSVMRLDSEGDYFLPSSSPPAQSLLWTEEITNWTSPFFVPANTTLPPRTILHLNIHPTCPPPPRQSKTPSDQIDFVYFFGKPYSPDAQYQLSLEQRENPRDTVIMTERYEDRDDGKILDWFRYARQKMYLPHPQLQGEWCPRYQYIGKSDDDTVIHVERLSLLLRNGVGPGSNYVGRLKWINDSPIPEGNKIGVEDVKVGEWLWDANLEVNLVNKEVEFHNLPSGPYFQRRIDGNSVVVHYCKHIEQFFECMKGLYDPSEPILTVDHYFIHPEMINYRIKFQFGLNVTNETQEYIFEQIYFKSEHTPLSLAEYDNLILENAIDSALETLGLFELNLQIRQQIIMQLRESSYDKWLVYDEPLQLIVGVVVESRMEKMGIREVDIKTYISERIRSLLAWILQDPEHAVKLLDFVILRDYTMGRGLIAGFNKLLAAVEGGGTVSDDFVGQVDCK
ncbi:hypothetical protein BDR26DRAFT_857246 [Obelidium mucronatum]|nr:hypothetical protein BDR26DRAFT_857246 [Obelidium mucronatum]